MKVDTHQHFWKYNENDYPWMSAEMAALRRDFEPPDLQPLLRECGIDATVAVQARQSLQETEWLLELAREYDFIRGVVGWVDLCSPQAGAQLERFAASETLRGVRHVIHDELDDEFMLRRDFLAGISLLAEFELTYDLLIFPKHLPFATELVRSYPAQPFVVDHIAKPSIRNREIQPWLAGLQRLAAFPNVFCKVSGMVTEAPWNTWQAEDLDVYMDAVFNAFGSSRILIGSDWPVCTLAGSYTRVMDIPKNYLARLSVDEQNAVWCENPRAFYGLSE
jgi:L-fuconolactonase